MHPIKSPQSKVGLKFKQKQQKANIHMETEQQSTQDNFVKEKVKKLKKLKLEFSENEDTLYQNLWDTMKAVLRGKLIALSASIKKLERSYTSNLTVHLKALEQKEANTPKRSRRQEIIKLRNEIKQLETKRTIQRINKTKSWLVLRESQQDRQTLSQTN